MLSHDSPWMNEFTHFKLLRLLIFTASYFYFFLYHYLTPSVVQQWSDGMITGSLMIFVLPQNIPFFIHKIINASFLLTTQWIYNNLYWMYHPTHPLSVMFVIIVYEDTGMRIVNGCKKNILWVSFLSMIWCVEHWFASMNACERSPSMIVTLSILFLTVCHCNGSKHFHTNIHSLRILPRVEEDRR